MLVEISKIIVGDRIRRDFGDIQELAEDIKENTLLNALVVTPSGDGTYTLIAGERRLRAMRDILGYTAVPVNSVGAEDAEQMLMMEISENECRKDFTKTERLEYARRLAAIESAKAKERMLAGKTQDPMADLPQGTTRDIVASQLGTSATQLRQEQFIENNRDLLDHADFAEWDEGRLSTNKAYQRIKAAQALAEQQRDEARDDLQDAYLACETMQREVESLKRQVAEKPKPEVIEREVVREVVPDDVQKRIDDLEYDNQRYSDDYQKLRKRNEELHKELSRVKGLISMGENTRDVQRDVEYLIAATNQYVRNYGGLTWTFEQIGDVDEATRSDLRKAIKNLATFSSSLMAGLEQM